MKRDVGPDLSTYLGINLDPILGPLFWGTFLLCQVICVCSLFR